MNKQEKIIKKENLYTGKILDLEKVYVTLPNQNESTREIVRHKGACAILVVQGDEAIMVRQYRIAVQKELLEIPAGKLDLGEDPLACAKRELQEETGYTCESMQLLTTFYTTPGFTDEILYIYLAQNPQKGKQHLDEDEFLDVESIKISTLLEMIERDEIKDSKTIIALLKYARMNNL